jgi:tripartite-type tricarboxylate transporter receptor subunit TctC
LIVPFPPGGLTDVIGPPLAEHMKPNLGTIIIENIGGGVGSFGGERPKKEETKWSCSGGISFW